MFVRSFVRSDGRTDGKFTPLFYRTSSPSGPLPKRKKKEKNPEKSFKKYNFFLQNDDPAMKNVGRGWHNEVHNEKNKCNEKNLSIFIHMQA